MGKKNKRGAAGLTKTKPGAAPAELDDATKRRRLSKPLIRESTASKAVILERMRRARLERGVERGRTNFRRYVPPKPKPLPGPAGWKLRGAARPWEEVEALKTADHHEQTVDLVEAHGTKLVEEMPSARGWRDALVDLFLDNGDVTLLEEALSIDAADERGAGLLALDAPGACDNPKAWSAQHLASNRALPRWTLFISTFMADDEDDDEKLRALERAVQANPYACWLLAFPQQADAAIEYAEEIGHDFAPAGILEAIHVHLHARRFFAEKRPATRTAVAAYVRGKSPNFPASEQRQEEGNQEGGETHPDAAMFVKMFSTLKEMAVQSGGESESCTAPHA